MSLPFLLSIPHGGTETPAEVDGHLVITPRALFDDIDPCTREIYDLGESVLHVVSTPIARSFVDVNRAEHDRPPRNPDGVVKSSTCFGEPIYRGTFAPDDALTETLLARYHRPYHQELRRWATDPRVVLGLDCHSMLEQSPAIAPDSRGTPRPLFCLGNRHGKTCSTQLLDALSAALAAAFDCPESQVARNAPFAGGLITAVHGHNPKPWIQVEMNRSWYLAEPWYDPDDLSVDPDRLRDLRERFAAALEQFAVAVMP